MPFTLDRIKTSEQIRYWQDNIPVEYLYTVGDVAEKFFERIRDEAKITGIRCGNCRLVYVPPRSYCEKCFARLEEWVELEPKGCVETYTIIHVDTKGSKLEKPVVLAKIKIDNAHGGFIHKLGEVNTEDVKIGMRVEAVFEDKDKRKGSILDIKYFRPADQPKTVDK